MPIPTLRRLAVLLACTALAITGCGDEQEPASGGIAPTTTVPAPGEGSTTTAPPMTEEIEVCNLLNAETVGSILQEEVTPQPAATGGCIYAGPSAASPSPLVTITPDSTGQGLAEARSAAQASVATTVEDVTVGGLPGYLALDAGMGAIGAAKDGNVVTIIVTGGEPATNGPILTQLLEHTLDAMS